MAKKKPKQVNMARKAALAGDVDAALPLLSECAGAGDDSAAASLAELLAFLGRWDEVIPYAGRLIANPFAVYAGNVFDDMLLLLGRAGRETGAWDRIAEVAAAARQRVEERLMANDMDFPQAKLEAQRARLCGLLDRLGDYAKGRGHAADEIIPAPVFAPNEAAFQAAQHNNKGKPAARLLSLAIAFSVDAEAIQLYPSATGVSFDQAIYVAQALVRSGEPEQAWDVIAAKVPSWSPVDAAQVAPVVLLVDSYLSQIVTPQRAAEAVRTPRGG